MQKVGYYILKYFHPKFFQSVKKPDTNRGENLQILSFPNSLGRLYLIILGIFISS